MSAPEFLDTSVLVWAFDSSDPRKQRIAANLVRDAVTGKVVISNQVLAEFAAILLHRRQPPAAPEALIRILDSLNLIRVITPDAEMVRRAVEANAECGTRLDRGMIIAAAERAGCRRIWSEDFNTGQTYFGILAQNPFD
jgi:predicted nucleic acid-binding protein